ncbi:AraC family transcriptional regulator [Saccharobesus litoralis]|uniref:AraC family transcriptional regulator n=1 Tax=Saccharobesus litoralis TaxID=2172099 RepID=A0A2S0VMT0_9ALTE|nr:response regulator transcription factor [Saccharobesus litoralis]AWB65527.1 AraC family transcriptional regulator [Saccharobesus litoralis]
MQETLIEWPIFVRAVIPFTAAHLFLMVLIYFTLVRRYIGEAYIYLAIFLGSFALFLCGPLVNVLPFTELKPWYSLFRNLLLFSIGIPTLVNGLFILAQRKLPLALSLLPYAIGLGWSIFFALTSFRYAALGLPALQGMNITDAWAGQIATIALILIAPCIYLLTTKPSKKVAMYIYGVLSFCTFMIIGNASRAWEVYYAGSSLTAIIWGWVVVKDIQRTSRKAEQHHQHEKALAKAQFATASKQAFSEFYPAELDVKYPFKEREELIEVVKTASHGLVEQYAKTLTIALQQYTNDNLATFKLRTRELMFMLYDVTIFASGESQPLIRRLESVGQEIEQCQDLEQIQENVIGECLYLVSVIAAQPTRSTDSNDLVDSIKSFVLNNYYKEFSNHDIAKAIGTSQSHMMKVFKQVTGTTINQFLVEIRIEKAKQRLLSQNVTDTALDVGFNNSTYFATVFKKHTGLSPKQYQKLAKQQG